jgi:hypothetical protein
MDRRKLATILIRDGWSCVRGSGSTFPLWKPESHLSYMLKSSFSDIIVASDDVDYLFALNTQCNVNLIAALGWSGVSRVAELFEAGYSKVFFGGVDRQFPNQKETEIFADFVNIYGASSFGYTVHFGPTFPHLTDIFLNQFNEILLVHDALQIQIDPEQIRTIAGSLDDILSQQTHELNLCAPAANHEIWLKTANKPINYVNYCEHAIARLR